MDALDIFDNDLSEYDDEPKESIVNESYNQSRERLFDEDDEIYPSIVFLENPKDFIVYIVDFQGYQVNKRFFFKELAIYKENEKSFQNYFCHTPVMSNSTTYKYLLNSHHRIPHNYGTQNYKNIIHILNHADIIYCKGDS